MGQVVTFPGASEREWRGIEEDLRRTYASWPDGPGTIEECLPDMRAHWEKTNAPYEVPVSYTVPGPLSTEQQEAIKAAVTQGMNTVSQHFRTERAQMFAALVVAEYKAAYYHRNRDG